VKSFPWIECGFGPWIARAKDAYEGSGCSPLLLAEGGRARDRFEHFSCSYAPEESTNAVILEEKRRKMLVFGVHKQVRCLSGWIDTTLYAAIASNFAMD
jgi:hypothetical protein